METGNDIRGNLKNIRFYSENIRELFKKQYQKDYDKSLKVGMDNEQGAKRFTIIGIAISNTEWLDTYCNSLEACVNNAEELDKLLEPVEEKQESLNKIIGEEELPF